MVTFYCWKLIWQHRMIGQNSGDKAVVWSIKLFVGNSGNKDDKHILEWTVPKIVILLEVKDVDFSTKVAITYGQGIESLVGSQL